MHGQVTHGVESGSDGDEMFIKAGWLSVQNQWSSELLFRSCLQLQRYMYS